MPLPYMKTANADKSDNLCHFCRRTFYSKRCLEDHISAMHLSLNKYICRCGLGFKWRYQRSMHQKSCPLMDKTGSESQGTSENTETGSNSQSNSDQDVTATVLQSEAQDNI